MDFCLNSLNKLQQIIDNYSYNESDLSDKLLHTFADVLPLRAYLLHWSLPFLRNRASLEVLSKIFFYDENNYKVLLEKLPHLLDFSLVISILSDSKTLKSKAKSQFKKVKSNSTVSTLFRFSCVSPNLKKFLEAEKQIQSLTNPLIRAVSEELLANCKSNLVTGLSNLLRTINIKCFYKKGTSSFTGKRREKRA